MEAVGKLINGKEIDLDELEVRANQAQIQKVSYFVGYSILFDCVLSFALMLLSAIADPCFILFQHYKISGLELGISSLADAITCRIAARDTL